MEDNEKTLTFKTPSGGRHYYFVYNDDIDQSFIGVNKYSIDVLSNGKYGIIYDLLQDAPIQPLPVLIYNYVEK